MDTNVLEVYTTSIFRVELSKFEDMTFYIEIERNKRMTNDSSGQSESG
jgi:adenylate cyclase class IV